MDKFLAGARAGEVVGHDQRFTINYERALELAKTVQLPERRAYILKLIQWAVNCKPSRIRLSTKNDGLTLQHDGSAPSEEELDRLRRAVVDFAYLSSGLFAALGLEPGELVLSSQDWAWDLVTGLERKPQHETGWTQVTILDIPKRLFERSAMVSRFLKSNWLQVSIQGALQKLILDAAGIGNLEAALVRTHCGPCAVPLQVNDKYVNTFSEPASGAYNARWDGGSLHLSSKLSKVSAGVFLNYCFSDSPGEILAPLGPLTPQGRVRFRNRWLSFPDGKPLEPTTIVEPDRLSAPLTLDGLDLFRAQGIYCPTAILKGSAIVYLVKDGVLIDQYTEHGEGLGGRALFSVGDLKVSADGFSLVRDEAFKNWQLNLRSIMIENEVHPQDFEALLKES